ncbi:uncharacterized protein LOC134531742 isoform X2 [Bacillus rossius redtenbacheri]|uniref:uncharacterized protein LOC134531742 isoform X2 n=1 Tax=Bacillus rossius redtenbacheri TaxID=93214 RepID=UPI002FDD9A80
MGSKQIFCKRTDVPPVEIVKRSGDENDVPKTDEEVKPEPLVLLEPMEHVKVEFHADEYGYWEQSLASVQSAAVSAPMGGAKQDFITSVESTSWVQAFGTKADNCCGEESEYVNTEFSPGAMKKPTIKL